MEATVKPLGNWKLRALPCAFVTMSDGRGHGYLGFRPVLLYLAGAAPRREILFQHAERINVHYFVPVN